MDTEDGGGQGEKTLATCFSLKLLSPFVIGIPLAEITIAGDVYCVEVCEGIVLVK